VGKPRGKLDMNRFLGQVLILMLQYRPNEITFARVSRHCGVPRSTLYYYFGASRVSMVDEAIRFGMQRFVQIADTGTIAKFDSWEAFEGRRMRRSLRIMSKYPWVAELYFRYRNEGGKFGESIRMIEEKYFDHMAEAWKHYHGTPADRHGVRMAAYMKIGMFFGFANDREVWRGNVGKARRESGLRSFGNLTIDLMSRGDRGARSEEDSATPARRSGKAPAKPPAGPRSAPRSGSRSEARP
jgi:AcrR family transcriptional regulator